MRKRVPSEIIPTQTETSKSPELSDEARKAEYATDLDLHTSCWCPPHEGSGKPWLKITLDEVHCVEKVERYYSNGAVYHTWTCADSDCNNCEGDYCSYYTLTVSTEGAVSDLSPVSDCKYGDTVRLERGEINSFTIPEIAIIGWQGKPSRANIG